jgi:hypothetical protein
MVMAVVVKWLLDPREYRISARAAQGFCQYAATRSNTGLMEILAILMDDLNHPLHTAGGNHD